MTAPIVKAVLLDAAGTLIRPREPVEVTYATVAARFGIALDPEELSAAFAEVFGDMPDLAFDWTTLGDLQRRERDWWRTLVSRVIAGSSRSRGDFEAFFQTLYEHYARGRAWECYPEVPEALRALRTGGKRLAVVSNFDSRLPGILRELAVDDRFDAIVYSSRAGSAKPDQAIFATALDLLDVLPEQAIHVGDSVRADLEGALAAGVTGLLIQRDHSAVARTEPVIRSLAELHDRIDAINR